MDLALKEEDEEFAASFRAWLGEHLRRPPAFVDLADEVAWGREWQATLAADRWVGVHWPEAYGGRSATPVQVALYQSEYARSQAPQPVNRVGINLVGPTLLAHGTEDQRLRYLPAILSAEEIWCQLFSEPDAGSDLASLVDAGHAGRRWVRGHRPQGVDLLRAVRHVGTVPGPDRSRRGAAPAGHHRVDRRHVRPRRRRAPARADDGRRRVQRGLPHRRLRPGRAPGRHRGAGLDGGRVDAGARTWHQLPVQGAGRARDLPGPPLRRGAGQRLARRPAGGRRAGPGLRGPRRAAPAQPAHPHPARAGRGAGARVELDQAHVDDHDPGHGRGGAARDRPRPVVGRSRSVGPPVALEQGGGHRRRHLAGAARHHRRADPGPAALLDGCASVDGRAGRERNLFHARKGVCCPAGPPATSPR